MRWVSLSLVVCAYFLTFLQTRTLDQKYFLGSLRMTSGDSTAVIGVVALEVLEHALLAIVLRDVCVLLVVVEVVRI